MAVREAGAALRRPATPRDAAPLRLPPGDRRRPRQLGGAARPVDAAARATHGRADRGPPARVHRLRGRHPRRRVRRRRRHRLGPGHVGAGDARRPGHRRPGRGAEVHPPRRAPARPLRASSARARTPSKEDWLLIHKDDEHADPTWDIDELPTSVPTGRTNEDVLLGREPVLAAPGPVAMDEIDLSAATEARMPEFISPMLATPVDRAFSDPGWLFEMKLDGYRRRGGRRTTGASSSGPAIARTPARTSPPSRRRARTGWRATTRSSTARWWRSIPRAGRASASSRTCRASRASACTAASAAVAKDAAACQDGDDERPRAASSSTPSTCFTSMGGTCWPSRSRSARSCCGSSIRDHPVGALRQPRRRARRGVPGGGHRAGARGQHREAAPEPLRARSPFAQLAEGQGAARAGARRHRLRARARAATRTSGRCSSRRARAPGGATPARSAAASTAAPGRSCATCSTSTAIEEPPALGRARAPRRPLDASRATSSGPSSPSGRRTACCARHPSRVVRWAAIPGPSRASGSSRLARRADARPPASAAPRPRPRGHRTLQPPPSARRARAADARPPARVAGHAPRPPAGLRRAGPPDEARAGRARSRRRPPRR